MDRISLRNSVGQQVLCLPAEAQVSPNGDVTGAPHDFWQQRNLNSLRWPHSAVRVEGGKETVLWTRP